MAKNVLELNWVWQRVFFVGNDSEFDAIPCIARLIYDDHDELENLLAKVNTFTQATLSEINSEFKLFLLENSEKI